ncbi:hypothetical protein IFO69_19745 [Echinicola sp. CAU 1574]|uniref:Integron Cassette Protein Hfx-Cass5 domain-containing protein n=1 Tax=Echinicola arenosa TaxID=2774144 RepID=A0ABR9AQC8_9BACT|nr:hypothetical protein [Echinicola arenosa]MBD8490996.1 hypothetical protein [Echinicola arenosa]
MKTETVNTIVLNENNELMLKITGEGNPSYQYVYREAAGVYWDEKEKGFKSTPLREWTVSKWFFHIKDIVKIGLNLSLEMDNNITWENIPTDEQEKIKNALQ